MGVFPQREPVDETYELSDRYRQLFERTYEFCSEIVRTGERLEERKRRVRYWGALALLRCVMSSPAAAVAALGQRAASSEQRTEGYWAEGEESEFVPFVFESADERTDDESPTPPVEAAEPHSPMRNAASYAILHGSPLTCMDQRTTPNSPAP